jgi:uncharacterized membrane protein YkoI
MKYQLMFALLLGCGGSQDRATVPPPNPAVSLERARTTALAAVPGQIENEELEGDDDGRWIYEFEIQPAAAGAPKQEVEVDAATGAVLKVEADD